MGARSNGSVVNGTGFVVDKEFVDECILEDPKTAEVLKQYLNGSDLNNNPNLNPSRWIINFYNWKQNDIKKYSKPYEKILNDVYPQRQNCKRVVYKEKWWQYSERQPLLYNLIKNNQKILVRTQVSKHNVFEFVENGYVYDQKLVVFSSESTIKYAILNSSLHETWVLIFCGDFGGILNYSPTKLYETYPFPKNISSDIDFNLNRIGDEYHKFRQQLMLKVQLGLTKTYNLFHTKELTVDTVVKASKQERIVCEEAYEDILKLRRLHKEMDEAVLSAYGWSFDDAQDKGIDLAHDFYEVDYLPENDRVRYTISPEARKEVLKRLLELNHKIHEQEVAAGLWDKKKSKTSKTNKITDPDQKDLDI